jgi:DnaJ like chaperone protein
MLASLRNRSYKQALLSRLVGSDPEACLPPGGSTELRFGEALFVVMGRLAKLDGRVTKAEIAFADTMMQRLGYCSSRREHAIACFDLGKNPQTNLLHFLIPLASIIGTRSGLAEQFLRIQCQLAQIKGVINPPEKIVLREVAEILGFDKSELLEICAALRPPEPSRMRPPTSYLREAYGVLQLEPDVGDSEIRKAYLKLMSRYHPDKLRRGNQSADAVRQAQEQTLAVRAAYEAVCGFRKIRA